MRELEVVSQQIHGLIEYIAHPLDAPPAAGRKPGRHALPGSADWPAITGGVQERQEEFTPMMALYVIGSAIAIIFLAVRLREARDQLSQVTHECDAYARTIQAIAPQQACLPAKPAEGYALPPAGHPDRRPAR